MYLNLCLLFYAQSLSGRTHKKMVVLAVEGQDCITGRGGAFQRTLPCAF